MLPLPFPCSIPHDLHLLVLRKRAMAMAVASDRKVEDMETEKLGPAGTKVYYVERFIRDRVPILRQGWPLIGPALQEGGIFYFLDFEKRFIRIKTTRHTRDPDMIEWAREFILLLSKIDVSPSTCIQILSGDLHHEFIKLGFQEGGLCIIHAISKERFNKQRKSLIGHRRELERLLDCQIYVNGNSATLVSTSLWSVKTARRAVERCFVENVNAADLARMMKARLSVERKLEGLRI